MGYYRENLRVLRKTKLPVNKNRVVNHRFIPKTLELSLIEWPGAIKVEFAFDNSALYHCYGRYESDYEAKKAYENLVRAQKRGKIRIDIYASGEARLRIEK